MNNSKLSVSIITYNAEKYIESVLDSVLNQETDFEYEIVIGDDGSQDRTPEILRKYAKNYSNVKAITRNENIGANKNYLDVLSNCTGEYIAHLDGDDLMLPGKLQKQVDFLDANKNVAAVFHNMRVFDDETGKQIRLYNNNRTPKLKSLENIVKYGAGLCHSSKMFRRSTIEDIEININTEVIFDWLMHIIHARHGDIAYINEVLGEYRFHQGGVVASNARKVGVVKDDLLKIVDFSKPYTSESVTLYAKARVNFERSLRFLEIGQYSFFEETIEESAKNGCFINARHKIYYTLKSFSITLRFLTNTYHKIRLLLALNHR
ncbi:glycosyltransferase [Pseudoalteromonas sp. 5-MNA-CIBAN-0065]|uniref:glycosyltransferase n=1 Tax=Pseudoalteromonas sp. 5-MNA-CIBAN-0065 TaxID=3140421 RepID=UPI003329EB84